MELRDNVEIALEILNDPHRLADPAVEEWLSVPEHRALYEELRVYLNAGLAKSDVRIPDTEIQYRLFQQKLERRKHLRLLKLSACAAAVVAIMFCSWLGVRSYVKTMAPEVQFAQEPIVPGKNQAVLVTESGESVVLGSEELKNVAVENGVEIDYDSVSGVRYKLSETAAVHYHTLKVPKGGEYKLALNDGTVVWLNSGSELKYPTEFRGETRLVILKGEAYFAVTRDLEKPFIVESGDVRTKVYGTEFNVRSYEEQGMDVTLVTGKISVTEAGTSKEYILKPGENARITDGSLVIEAVNVQKYTAWKDGYFYYEDESLESILSELERWYDFTTFFANENVKGLRFELWAARHTDIASVLNLLTRTNKVKMEVKGKTLVVSEAKR